MVILMVLKKIVVTVVQYIRNKNAETIYNLNFYVSALCSLQNVKTPVYYPSSSYTLK